MKATRGQIIAHIACLVPFALMMIGYFSGALTANPIQSLTLRSGRTAVNLLMLTLACRPLSNFLGLTSLFKVRITLGVYAFFYALLHFLVFAGLDFEFNLPWIWDEIKSKLFIDIGLAALFLLIPLVVTSIENIRVNLGKYWQLLHRLIYVISALALTHYFMATKGDPLIPIFYGIIFLLLMIFRLPPFSKIRVKIMPGWLADLNQYLLKS